jgi:hypothetical protein
MLPEELKNEIFSVEKPTNWRNGQFVFNYVDEVYGVARIAQFQYGVDCFYRDDKIDEFIATCCEIINNNTKE